MNLCSEKPHPVYIESLTPGIFLAHENLTFHIHQSCRCSRSNAVLTCAGFSDHTGLSHLLCQKDLTQYVVDLVSSGVV